LWEQHHAAFQPVLDAHNGLMRGVAGQWNGLEVKTVGDAFLLVFSKASDAAQFAVDAQLAFARHDWKSLLNGLTSLRVRMGIHTGEAIFGHHPNGVPDYFGPAVNCAARVEAAGHGGQILVSDTTLALVRSNLPPDITFQDLGVHRLKGIGEQRLWQVCHPDLPRDFPPLNAPPAERVHLPMFPTPFMGREQEIERVKEILMHSDTRLLLLFGTGGVGKTRLSVRVAEEVSNQFPDGVYFVELESDSTQSEMFARIRDRLRLASQPNKTDEQMVLEFLENKNLLLVLDNVEQIPDAPDALDKILRKARRVKCLTSSRERFEMQGARSFEVKPLPVPALKQSDLLKNESVQFFVARARERQHNFQVTKDNASDIAALCRQLDGVPLALELAAAWMPMSPGGILGAVKK
jgi:class 3 adenylate cyclase